ncbi:MAG: HAD family phosphatase [Candidatus Omnitrophica bacterium]|nr:HAD family phosphatase [Candidatus Omnitrophota bacterium]
MKKKAVKSSRKVVKAPLKKKPAAKKSPIKTVIFDMGNVLLHYDATKAGKAFAKVCGTSFLKLWLHFFTSPIEKAYTRGEMSTRDFYKYSQAIFKKPVSFEDFKKYWNEIFWENEGMEKILVRLKKNYPLFVISNTNDMHFEYICKEFAILRHFDRLFPSHKVGARKPDALIYQKVLRAIKYKPEETVFIDDVPKFVRGAQKVGMHAIRFRSNEQLVRDLKKLGVKI